MRKTKDSMTPLERAQAIAKGQAVDRMPCNPNLANGVARVLGCKISEFNTDANRLAQAQIAAYRRFGYDSVRIFTDLFPWAEAYGAKIKFPEDHTADLMEPAIKDIKDYKNLRTINPRTDGRLPVQLEAMKILIHELGNELSPSAGIVGPFTNASFLLGAEKLLKSCRKNPEVVHYLCRVSTDMLKEYADAVIEIGLSPTISEPMSSCTVISPAIFREFSLPYLKELCDHIKSKGKAVTMHICGQTSKIWEDLADMGIAALSIDNVASLTECKQLVGNRVKILGNVNPATTMYLGSPDEVKLASLKCIKEGYDSPKGYMLMSGCSLPVETPFESVDAMMDVVSELGYPINPVKLDAMIAELTARIPAEDL